MCLLVEPVSEDTDGKWIVHFPYLHRKSGVVQVDKKSTNLDQAKSSSREISILNFFFHSSWILSLLMKIHKCLTYISITGK